MKDLEDKYRKAARRIYQDEGRIEVDEGAEVSISACEDVAAEGCYVQAWVYVDADEVE